MSTASLCQTVPGTSRYYLPLRPEVAAATGYRPYDGRRPKQPHDLILKPPPGTAFEAESLGLECEGYWPNADLWHRLTEVGPDTVHDDDVAYIRPSRSQATTVRNLVLDA